jgi:hypothetical protein
MALLPDRIHHIACSTVDEFLDTIRPLNPHWHHPNHPKVGRAWGFRGHADAQWPLWGTSIRSTTDRDFESVPWKFGDGTGLNGELVTFNELLRLRDFFTQAANTQLRVPENIRGYFTEILRPTFYGGIGRRNK